MDAYDRPENTARSSLHETATARLRLQYRWADSDNRQSTRRLPPLIPPSIPCHATACVMCTGLAFSQEPRRRTAEGRQPRYDRPITMRRQV